jgi:hypothetical protein
MLGRTGFRMVGRQTKEWVLRTRIGNKTDVIDVYICKYVRCVDVYDPSVQRTCYVLLFLSPFNPSGVLAIANGGSIILLSVPPSLDL